MNPASFRDCKAWQKEGLPLSTSSNEACKLYDALLTQYVTWRSDETLGGVEGCISALRAADPNFVMGHVIGTGLELVGTGSSVRLNGRLAGDVARLAELAAGRDLAPRERLHARAVELFAKGCLPEACELWDEILLEHPTDMLAVKFAHDGYFYLGRQAQLRDSVARVLPHWTPQMPLYSYLKGMYSFGLLETHFYDQAEKTAKEGLELNREDGWAVHAVAHVHEMRAEADQGLHFMESRERDWKVCDMLASHNYWHWALYFTEKGRYEEALGVYDDEVVRRCKASGSLLDTVDACSLLYRLEMEGVNVKDRWRELLQVTKPHTEDHVLLFNDLHFLMTSLGAKDEGTTHRLLETLQELAEAPGENFQHKLAGGLGVPMCQAMVAYDRGDFGAAADLLRPLRYRFAEIGGSDAQRDLFHQLLVHSAMKSDKKQHQKLARCLLVERDAARPNSPLTHRLIQRARALHA
ncbi:tetratricopeptide repeat protein 38 [Anguilla anguilla]|uniref:tetratricopeptide repeat protein 38 n=1 Tax=Anguilla anguilla TaxID=7936 RepID=UPI0015AA1976|nr:tetratricopeptide repeat protein 38 [Anguilla anguilla]